MTFQKGNNFGKMNKGKRHISWNKGKKTGLVPKTAFKKGHKHTEEWKEMMRTKMKGRISPMLGKHHTEEYKREKSEKHRGKDASNWQGGLTKKSTIIRHSIEYRLWREAVFARDNWTCQKSNIKGGKLEAHHILNFAKYPEQRFAIDNGITLSKKAHKEFHKIYSKRNNTREQLIKFLN